MDCSTCIRWMVWNESDQNQIFYYYLCADQTLQSTLIGAGQFASVIRDRHARFQKYGLDLNNPKHHELLYPIENMEKTESEIVRKHKLRSVGLIKSGGVILAISDKVRDEFEVVVGGDGDDLNIKTNALPLRYVVGIEPVDDYSFDVLDSL